MNCHVNSRSICIDRSAVSEAFSALHLLQSYHLFAPAADFCRLKPCALVQQEGASPSEGDILHERSSAILLPAPSVLPSPTFPASLSFPLGAAAAALLQPTAAALSATSPFAERIDLTHRPNTNVSRSGTTAAAAAAAAATRQSFNNNAITDDIHEKKARTEKRPIPDEQKDEKYYERRKRNNQAAKKSRDARRIREDNIALRAVMLEHENAMLRAQILVLREEAQCLRRVLASQESTSDFSSTARARPRQAESSSIYVL
ncbi:hepatic leukemia factor [Prorops nasuta]|uniref:hepatic leukemia factor n=1 Tax=Prorops nasuta TaxID=863751 RepID=UPI0034CEE466